MPDRAVAENAAFCSPRCIRSGSSQASSTWAAEPARMVSCEPTGMVSRRPEGRSAAATQTRWSPWRRHSWADSPVMSRSRASTGPAVASSRSSPAAADELGEPRAEHEAALHVAGDQPVVLEGHGQAVRGRSGQPGAGDQAGQGGRAGLQRREHEGGLVEDADSARVVHMAILPSQIMGCKR